LRFVEFFTAHIRNPNTWATCGVVMRDFFTWREMRDLADRQQAAAAASYLCQIIGGRSPAERDPCLACERRAGPLRLGDGRQYRHRDHQDRLYKYVAFSSLRY
jgi:hypothetical protein